MVPHKTTSNLLKLAAVSGLAVFLYGCAFAGPNAISSGRLAYNEAIAQTNDQQMLMVLVHNRYEESHHMLAVASVTANVKVSSRAGVELGFGDSDNYDGNLVPFSGGFLYEENPTISYVPVSGEAYVRQLTAPVPLPFFTAVSQSLPKPGHAYHMLIASINDIRNPSFLYGEQRDDPRFDTVVDLMVELTHRHCLYWSESASGSAGVVLTLSPSSTHEADKANELLALLGMPANAKPGEALAIPVFDVTHGAPPGALTVTTHSITRLVQLMSSSVEVPAEHIAEGRVEQFPTPGRAGRDITIRYSVDQPESAYVSAQYKDGWFYIDERDLQTKRYFKLLGNLWSAAMTKSLGMGASTPVLTVPVSS